MLLELAEQASLNPKKISSTKGGVYDSPCPACGGNDRFMIWPAKGRYWCRQCKRHGDPIQFCRDFLGMSFKEAKEKVGLSDNGRYEHAKNPEIQVIRTPTRSWQEKAIEFVESCSKRLLIDSEAISFLKSKYGLTLDTVPLFRVGWNPESRFQRRSEWGLQEADAQISICLSRGIVIPSFLTNGFLSKIKIRRLDEIEIAKYGKYQEVKGGSNLIPIYGLLANQVFLIVESELDAMCLCQEIGEFCTCLALGGATKRPDPETMRWLQSKRLILYSLDLDDAGREQYDYWRSHFPNLRPWLAETRKSPADSYVLDGVDLKKWFETGIRHWEGKL